mgnify:CR=1 FL=1
MKGFSSIFSFYLRIHEERNEFKMNGVTPKPHTYYQVLIDQRDCPYVVGFRYYDFYF